MTSRASVLREVMVATSTTQGALSRLSGVRQPSISQALSGRIEISDEQLARLLACMGFRLEVVRRPVAAELTRSERRSWSLHRIVAEHLDGPTLLLWRATIDANLERLRRSVRGEPHVENVGRWRAMVDAADLGGLHRVLTGLDRDDVAMREVSPFGGVLTEHERAEALAGSR